MKTGIQENLTSPHFKELMKVTRKPEGMTARDLKAFQEEIRLSKNDDLRLPLLKDLVRGLCPLLEALKEKTDVVPQMIEVSDRAYEVRKSVQNIMGEATEKVELKPPIILVAAKMEMLGLQQKAAKIISQLFIHEWAPDLKTEPFQRKIADLTQEAQQKLKILNQKLDVQSTQSVEEPDDMVFLDRVPTDIDVLFARAKKLKEQPAKKVA